MTNKDNCAFPADSKTQTDGGLTKREYIASQVMQGILAADTKEGLKFSFEQVVPKLALMYADELLKLIEGGK